MKEFEFGDKVYFPRIGVNITTLEENDINSLYFKISHGNNAYTLTKDGKHTHRDIVPFIFHANDKNRKMLSEMYNLDFELPMKTITYEIPMPFIPKPSDVYWYIAPNTTIGYECSLKAVATTYAEGTVLSLGVYRTEDDVRIAFNNQRRAIAELVGQIK